MGEGNGFMLEKCGGYGKGHLFDVAVVSEGRPGAIGRPRIRPPKRRLK